MINDSFILHCPAKINLSLLIGKKRFDGFHDLGSIFQTIDIFDEIKLHPHSSSEKKIKFISNINSLEWNNENILYKTVKSLENNLGITFPFNIELKKKIPMCGGLGGGSSNAALLLRFAKFFFKVSRKDIFKIALSLGSDVPYFLHSGTCFVFGRGERIISSGDLGNYTLDMSFPKTKISTAKAFKTLDSNNINDEINIKNLFHLYENFKNKNYSNIQKYSKNSFEKYLLSNYNEIRLKYNDLKKKNGVLTRVSGSGSSIFTIFDNNRGTNKFIDSKEVFDLNEYRWVSSSQNYSESKKV